MKKKQVTFKKLTPAQKRVAIAKDVLKQIKAKKFLIESGNFAIIRNGIMPDPDVFDKGYLLSKEVEACDVCAIGAAIISGIRLFNKVTFNNPHIDPIESWNLIREFFEPEQAVLIENAFEIGCGAYNENWSEEEPLPEVDQSEIDKAMEFGQEFDNETERAVAIFTNIVQNKGVFKP